MGPLLNSIDEVVREIMNLHRSLPPRPSIEEVEAAMEVIRSVDKDKELRIESILKQKKGFEIPEELFFVLQEMQKSLVQFQSKEQKREARKLLDLENVHALFDDYIQRASRCVPSSSDGMAQSVSEISSVASVSTANSRSDLGSSTFLNNGHYSEEEMMRSSKRITRDDSYVKKAKSGMYVDGGSSSTDLSLSRGMLMSSMTSAPITSGESDV